MTVKILNPGSGKKYTSLKRAKELVWSGRAKWEVQGNGQEIRLTELAERIRERQEVQERIALAQYRGGIVFWNGADHNPGAMRKPGEVRS